MRKIILIATILLMSTNWSYAQKVGEVIDVGEGIIIEKPDIDPKKILDENESKQVKDILWNDDVKLIFKELYPAKNDYKDSFDRGTVYYTPLNRNYSFSRVIIPDGATVRGCNFTQKNPGTEAIFGSNLTFIDCNLVNNEISLNWIIKDCNVTQRVLDEE